MPPRRGYRRSRGGRKATGWVNHTLVERLTSAPGVTTSDMLDGLSTAEQAAVDKILAIQWRGAFSSQVSGSETHGRWGIGIVTADAFNSGTVVSPLTDHQFPWYWSEPFSYDEITADVRRHHIQGKVASTRRMPSRVHTLMLAVEAPSTAAAGPAWDLAFRILYQLR